MGYTTSDDKNNLLLDMLGELIKKLPEELIRKKHLPLNILEKLIRKKHTTSEHTNRAELLIRKKKAINGRASRGR